MCRVENNNQVTASCKVSYWQVLRKVVFFRIEWGCLLEMQIPRSIHIEPEYSKAPTVPRKGSPMSVEEVWFI